MNSDADEEPGIGALTHCPVCGGASFHWGALVAQFPIWFYVDQDAGPIRMFTTGKETRARVCKRCGNVQFFVNIP